MFSDLLPADSRRRNVKRIADDLTLKHGGRVDKVYETAIKGFSVEMPAERAEALSRDPRVKYIEEDFEVYAAGTQYDATWGIDRIDQRTRPYDSYYNDLTTGMGVHAYVIDSGIRSSHVEFGGRVLFGADYVNDGQNGNDCDGHGTHVAGTIGSATFGVAKNVTLHNLRVLGCDGRGTGTAIIAAINWVTNNRVLPAVANFSIGMDGISTSVETALANSISSGVNYSLAAGNDSKDACANSPGGRVPTAVTVAASSDDDTRAWFSNYGPCVIPPDQNPPPIDASPAFIGYDSFTKGNWIGKYGSEGRYKACEQIYLSNWINFPTSGLPAHCWYWGQTDERALLQSADSTLRTLGVAGSATQFDIPIDLTDLRSHRMAIYFVDFDGRGRQQTVEIINADTGEIIDTRTVSNFNGGRYLVWQVRGKIILRVKNNGGPDAVLSGVFFDPLPEAPVPPSDANTAAKFIAYDAATQGNWVRPIRPGKPHDRRRDPTGACSLVGVQADGSQLLQFR